MSHWTVAVIAPPGYIHWRAYEDLAQSISAALHDLTGRQPAYLIHSGGDQWPTGNTIVLGAHLLPHYPEIRIPDDAIIYNTEVHGTEWTDDPYMELLARHKVLDYSEDNITWFKANGIDATLCHVGYHKALERIKPAKYQDIDVLFYGSVTPRREQIIRQLVNAGINITYVFGVYGKERDDLIARSKIVLNCHAYEQSPTEWVRLQLLYANRACVLDEDDCMRDRLSAVAEGLLRDPVQRDDIATACYESFKRRPMADSLARALDLPIPQSAAMTP